MDLRNQVVQLLECNVCGHVCNAFPCYQPRIVSLCNIYPQQIPSSPINHNQVEMMQLYNPFQISSLKMLCMVPDPGWSHCDLHIWSGGKQDPDCWTGCHLQRSNQQMGWGSKSKQNHDSNSGVCWMLWWHWKQVCQYFTSMEYKILFVSFDFINVRKPVPDSCRHPVSGNRYGYNCPQVLAWWLEPWTSTLASISLGFCLFDVVIVIMTQKLRTLIQKTNNA